MEGTRPYVLSLVLCIPIAMGVVPARAVPTTFASRAAFDAAFPGAQFENWDGFAAGTTFVNGSTVNGITYTSSATMAVVQSTFFVTTSPNGLGRTPGGFFLSGDTITFGFVTPLLAFGIDINTFAATAGAYTATTDTAQVIASVFDPFPGFATGQFVGFSDTTPFSSITIAATTDFSYTLDTLRASPVPESSTSWLMGLSLVGLAFYGWRKRKQAA